MSETVWMTDGSPVLIAGPTGAGARYGGKSSTANWWRYQIVEAGHYDLSVFWDPKGKRYIKGRRITTKRPWRQIARALRDPDDDERHFQVVPPEQPAPEIHAQLTEFVRQLDRRVVFVHDDAADYAGIKRSGEYVAGVAKAVSRMGNEEPVTKNIVVAQRFWDVPDRVRQNCVVYVWVGPLDEDSEQMFKSMGRASKFDVIRERHTEPYVWSVMDGTEVHTYPPVPGEFAGE